MLSGSPLRAVGQIGDRDAEGSVALRVVVTNNGAAARGATVRALLAHGTGNVLSVPLLDDGVNGDGVAGDGVFSARTASLDGDIHGALVEVVLGDQVRIVPLDENGEITPPPSVEYRVLLPALRR
jgi:large repetitive protein